MIHLRTFELARQPAGAEWTCPLSNPAIWTLQRLEFTSPVTFFAGERLEADGRAVDEDYLCLETQ